LNYRSQWASIGNPYTTYSVNIDGGLFKNKWKSGYIGAGLSIYKDVAGASNLGLTMINLSLSSVIYLDSKNSASIGFTGSWGQNSIDPSGLQWDSQFNGQSFDASMPSNESFQYESSNFFDFSAGALWAYGTGAKTLSSKDEFNTKIGVAFYHVTRPNNQLEFGVEDRLYSKFLIHSETHVGIANTKIALRPKTILYFQGPTREINLGLMVRYRITEESKYTGIMKEMAISFGGYYRVGDAFSPSIEFELSSFAIGAAYDMNISGLSPATKGKGGPEIYLKYINPNPFRSGRGTKSTSRFR